MLLDVGCVDERLIEVECDDHQGILYVHCVAERLVDVEDLDCVQVDDVECNFHSESRCAMLAV